MGGSKLGTPQGQDKGGSRSSVYSPNFMYMTKEVGIMSDRVELSSYSSDAAAALITALTLRTGIGQ